jgi:hypothetical protein
VFYLLCLLQLTTGTEIYLLNSKVGFLIRGILNSDTSTATKVFHAHARSEIDSMAITNVISHVSQPPFASGPQPSSGPQPASADDSRPASAASYHSDASSHSSGSSFSGFQSPGSQPSTPATSVHEEPIIVIANLNPAQIADLQHALQDDLLEPHAHADK